MIIGLDVDGTVLNYGWKRGEPIHANPALMRYVAGARVALITNQGGAPFGLHNDHYPSVGQIAYRLDCARQVLIAAGCTVESIRISTYHDKADPADVQRAARYLRDMVAVYAWPIWHVYTTPDSRKPAPKMLTAAGCSLYIGDSPEDIEAAKAAGCEHVRVCRYYGDGRPNDGAVILPENDPTIKPRHLRTRQIRNPDDHSCATCATRQRAHFVSMCMRPDGPAFSHPDEAELIHCDFWRHE